MNASIAGGSGGRFRLSLCHCVGENGDGLETVRSMTCGGPLQSLLGSPFLGSTAIKVDVGISGGCFRFLNTLGLSSKIAFLPFFIPTSPLGPSLVKTCFESTIPKKLQVSSFSRRRCGIAKPNNVVDVGEGDECFKIDGIIWWRWCGFHAW